MINDKALFVSVALALEHIQGISNMTFPPFTDPTNTHC